MTRRTRVKVGVSFVIVTAILSVMWFLSSDLKAQLFDIPAREAQKQSIVRIISMLSANDELLGENHYAIDKTNFCLYGYDGWTYKSSRSWSELVQAFSQTGWRHEPYRSFLEITGEFYYPPIDVFYVELEEGEAVNTYTVSLLLNDPMTPLCGRD
ncbi:MAG: hypothetical protein KF716_11140 [Anaerolineae bacterium]|nr:hypothetical protein [Anaerolineae bacterium]